MTENLFSSDALDKLAKITANPVATAFLNKVSSAIGTIYGPVHIKRMAKAELESTKLDIEKSDLQRRAEYRKQEEDIRHQRNIENIVIKAANDMGDNANPDFMENDWIANFFDKCKNVSDEEMQGLWARILAGEANNPGAYSKRTINFLTDMSKIEADLFTCLCGFVCEINSFLRPVIFDYKNKIYDDHKINFSTLSHLQSIGLIDFSQIGYNISKTRRFLVTYYGHRMLLRIPNTKKDQLTYGQVRFTLIGEELAPIAGGKPVNNFWEHMASKWKTYIQDQ